MRKSLLFLTLLICSPLRATIYYVDNCVNTGNDSYDGKEQSHTSGSTGPWLTIAKVNASTFSAGDSILFRQTCTWNEQLVVPSSGSSGSPITFGEYGTGARPVINGTYYGSGWTNVGGSSSNTSVIASLDDYYVSPSASSYAGTANFVIMGDLSGTSRDGGFRMILNMPQGQTISTANLTLTMNQNSSLDASVLIHANLSTDSSQVTSYSQWSTAHGNLTSSSVTYSFPNYTTGQALSISVTAIVQEIVNQGGWVSGNHIQFFVDDNSNGSNVYAECYSYDSGSTPANLSVTSGYPYAWYVTGVPNSPTSVWFNGTLGTSETSVANLTGANEWFWDTSTDRLYVYSTSTPSNTTWQVGTTAVEFNAQNYVTVDHLNIGGGVNGSSVSVDSTTQHATVQYCAIGTAPTGITNSSSGGSNSFHHNVVTAPTTGISITSSGSGDTYYNNTIAGFSTTGILLTPSGGSPAVKNNVTYAAGTTAVNTSAQVSLNASGTYTENHNFWNANWTGLTAFDTTDKMDVNYTLLAPSWYPSYDLTAAVGNNGTVYAVDNGSHSRVYSGGSWAGPYTVASGGHPTKLLFLDHRGYLFTAASTVSALYKSTDGGQTWTKVLDLSSLGDAAVAPQGMTEDGSGNLYTSIYSSTYYNPLVYMSTDTGNTWTNISASAWANPPSGLRHVHYVYYDPFRQTLFANVGDTPAVDELYYSTNNGTTWTAWPSLTGIQATSMVSDAQYIYYWRDDTDHGIERATTAGGTLTHVCTNTNTNDVSWIAQRDGAGNIIFMGYYEILISRDQGNSWYVGPNVYALNSNTQNISYLGGPSEYYRAGWDGKEYGGANAGVAPYSISVNPAPFVSRTNYQPAAASSAICGGANSSFTVDFAGNPIIPGCYSMGAYQYQPRPAVGGVM